MHVAPLDYSPNRLSLHHILPPGDHQFDQPSSLVIGRQSMDSAISLVDGHDHVDVALSFNNAILKTLLAVPKLSGVRKNFKVRERKRERVRKSWFRYKKELLEELRYC